MVNSIKAMTEECQKLTFRLDVRGEREFPHNRVQDFLNRAGALLSAYEVHSSIQLKEALEKLKIRCEAGCSGRISRLLDRRARMVLRNSVLEDVNIFAEVLSFLTPKDIWAAAKISSNSAISADMTLLNALNQGVSSYDLLFTSETLHALLEKYGSAVIALKIGGLVPTMGNIVKWCSRMEMLSLKDITAYKLDPQALSVGRQIDDELVGLIATCKTIKELNISINTIGPMGIQSLATMPKLERLKMSSNQSLHLHVRDIATAMQHLRELHMAYTGLVPEDMESISMMENLEILDVRMNPIGDIGAQHLSRMLLKELYASGCFIGDVGIRFITKMPLESLNVSRNPYRHAAGDLATMALKKLNIDGNPIGAAWMDLVANTTLVRLSCVRCDIQQLEAVKTMGRIGNILTLNIPEQSINDFAVEYISRVLPMLQVLNIRNNRVTHVGAEHISLRMKKLSRLDAMYNPLLGDEGVRYLADLELTELQVSGFHISQETILAVSKMESLRTLSMYYENVDDAGVEYLSKMKLIHLSLYGKGLSKITEEGEKKILKMENLQVFNEYEVRPDGSMGPLVRGSYPNEEESLMWSKYV